MSALGDKLAEALRSVPATSWPELEKARGEIAGLRVQSGVCWEQLARLRGEREQAAAADLDALADSLRAGKQPPKARSVVQVDARIAEAEERAEALKLALSKTAAELVAVMVERRPEWLAGLDADLAPALDNYRQKIAELEQAREALLHVHAQRAWLANFDQQPNYKGGSPPLHGLRNGAGQPTHWSAVVAALRQDLEPGQEQQRPIVYPLTMVGRTAA